ncbi:MAG: hypothetical protein ABR543_14095 [Gemmatimonadaceae bacterium]
MTSRAVSAPSRAFTATSPSRAYARLLRSSSYFLLWAGLMTAVAGWNAEPGWILGVGSMLVSAGFVFGDISHGRARGISPMTVYAFTSSATGLANAVGLLSVGGTESARYFIYAADEHLLLAAQLAFAGAVLPVLSFRFVTRQPGIAALFQLLPLVKGYLPTKRLAVGCLVLSSLSVAVRALGLSSLGTLGGIFFLAPVLSAFVLARTGARLNNRRILLVGLAIALVEAARAVGFSYLRSEIVAPLAAFALGSLLGARSFRPLKSPIFFPIYAASIAFAIYFGTLGQVRATSGEGLARITAVQQYEGLIPQGQQTVQEETLLSRLTSFNQLSQVGRIVSEDGFLDGVTLEYLGFAFIPRFIWPEKPLIAKGAWFAWRIGQAYITPTGAYSNSVNMTVAGELYLNFGWLGVVMGCLSFGVILGALWSRTDFWVDEFNTLGSALGFYLLWVGLGLAADLQIIVTLAATYMLFVAGGYALRSMGGRQGSILAQAK